MRIRMKFMLEETRRDEMKERDEKDMLMLK